VTVHGTICKAYENNERITPEDQARFATTLENGAKQVRAMFSRESP
jgi:hypothetical protein